MVGFTHEASTLLRLKNLTISHLQNKFNALPLFWFQNQLPAGKIAKFMRNQLSTRKLHQTADLRARGARHDAGATCIGDKQKSSLVGMVA